MTTSIISATPSEDSNNENEKHHKDNIRKGKNPTTNQTWMNRDELRLDEDKGQQELQLPTPTNTSPKVKKTQNHHKDGVACRICNRRALRESNEAQEDRDPLRCRRRATDTGEEEIW